MSNTKPTLGLFVPLPVQSDKAPDVNSLLHGGRELDAGELQWYALQYTGDAYTSKPKFAVFDTFAGEEGRGAHLSGKVGQALKANAATLVDGDPKAKKVEILASKIQEGVVNVGLRVLAEAKPDKVEEVKQFLVSALPLVEEETLTPQWYAIKLENSNFFGVLDFFEGDEGRRAHINGKVAAALSSKADEFFVNGKAEVVEVDVLASRVL